MRKILLAGTLTTVLVPYVLALVAVMTGFALSSISVSMIVPVGAAACSFAAISGFFLTAQRQGIERPIPVMLIAMVVGSLVAYILLLWFAYQGAFITEYPAADAMAFTEFVRFSIENSEIAVQGQAPQAAGEAGYIGAITELIAFAIIPCVAYRMLPSSRGFLED